ncbi:MAG: hypothetical protein Q8L55_01430, partial [Phycisphaerales bacterium]|nr:hypothetical protein [Phycisphaerales bacterium]
EKRLDRLIESLTISLLTAHPARGNALIQMLRHDLKVQVRKLWCPDAAWLAGYKKCQLAHLIGELRGAAYIHAAQQAKKSELVESLAKLFADAAEGKLNDKELVERLNRWLPENLREPTAAEQADRAEAA